MDYNRFILDFQRDGFISVFVNRVYVVKVLKDSKNITCFPKPSTVWG
jgi:hypothetical protein